MKKTVSGAIKILFFATACLSMMACTHSDIHPAGPYPKPLTDFQYRMMIAIDQAKIYPWQASENHIQGVATVSFDYLDGGHATNLHVDGSTGNNYLDQAALQAVADAKMPPKPGELSGI